MSNEFANTQFVADAILAHIKEGFLPSNEDARRLDSRPLIDTLRSTISGDDIPWLLSIVDSAPDAMAGLACSLLREHATRSEVRTCFENRWYTASPYVKNRLMWRMLDDPALPHQLHQEFFNFILAEWNTFTAFNRGFYGDGKQGIYNLLSRIGDITFPESKKWIYLCCVPAVVEDLDAAKALMTMGLTMNDPFAHEVATRLLQAFLSKSEIYRKQLPSIESKENDGFAFISSAVVSHMRSGHLPWEQEADYLNRLPLIDFLRMRITEDDLPWILKVIDTNTGEVGALCLSLLRRFSSRTDIQETLRERWNDADTFFKAHLMWRLLDDPNLPSDWHERLFDFVLNEWPTFKEVSLKFLGTPETVVLQALLRMGDSSFPDSMKWAYLCRVPEVAKDQVAAKSLVTLGASMPDPFCKKVADVLLQRFFSSDY